MFEICSESGRHGVVKRNRQSDIVQTLDAEGMLGVTELSERFDVSEMTIRRDLLELENAGLIRRVHGGATRALGRAYEPPFRMRQASGLASKQAIARAAAALIDEGDAIGLDVGSTVLEMVPEFIDVDNLTVVTASLRVATRVAELHALEHSVRLIVTGGVTRADELSLIGQSAVEFYRSIRLDKAFISVGGIGADGTGTEFNLEDAEVKRAMIQSSNDVIVLADSSKLGQTGFAFVVDLRRTLRLITDSGADPEILEQLRSEGVTVDVVDVVDIG